MELRTYHCLTLQAVLTSLLSILMIVVPALAGEEIAGTPKIVFESNEINIGQVKPGDKAIGIFIVENQGNADLVIMRVAPT